MEAQDSMSLIVAFVIALMSSVFHNNVFQNNVPQCKHGAHVHVIWKNHDCQGDSKIYHSR